jgi:hypothetical protein
MMRKSLWIISALLLSATIVAPKADADALVTINFSETTVLNGTAAGTITGIPLTFESSDEILTIAIDWADTGTANFPFPLVYGAEDNIVLDDGVTSAVCNYLYQNGPSSYYTVDCDTLEAPYVSSVTYAGNWGSATIGFAGSEPITIDSTFTEQTIVSEGSSFSFLGLGLVGLGLMIARQKRICPVYQHITSTHCL